jgi:UDP-GlcNAc:undecaprenyl-phosphate GlcNAc-1-phosphate transferase
MLRRLAMWDDPNARSSHTVPTPRGGGVAVVLALLVAVVATSSISSVRIGGVVWILILCWIAAALLGLADDARGMSARLRLVGQAAISGVLVTVMSATAPVETNVSLLLFVVVAFVGIVGYVNAFNFMDGINGISGLSAAIGGFYYGWLATSQGQLGLAIVSTAFGGAALGFLPWNFPRARVFLGDVGSYFMGACLSSLAAVLWLSGAALAVVCAPLVIYLADTAATLLRRAGGGRPLFEAHREHSYQRLSDRFGHVGATTVATGASGICVLIAVIGRHQNSAVILLAMMATAAGYLVCARLLSKNLVLR